MTIRNSDFASLGGSITVDRKIPLWGILSLLGAIAVQAVMLWNGQQLQGQKMDALTAQLRELSSELKETNSQLSAKSAIDSEQNFNITDIRRRLLIIESQHEAQRDVRR